MRRRLFSTSGGTRVLADGHPRARGVEQADRFVGQLTIGNVALGELDRRLERFVEELHPVMLLERRRRPRAS